MIGQSQQRVLRTMKPLSLSFYGLATSDLIGERERESVSDEERAKELKKIV